MTKPLASPPAGTEPAAPPAESQAQAPAGEENRRADFVVATHDALFEEGPLCCDACGEPLEVAPAEEGFDVPGCGVYLWARGSELSHEEAPLCAACASAIGMTALARWEIEEEEG